MTRYIRDIIITIFAALAIFLLLQIVIQPFEVHGISMLPGIREGDRIIINKSAYLFQNPQRGDVIVLQSPRSEGIDLIKRVIGVPGDTVEVKKGTVYVNKVPLVEPYVMAETYNGEPPYYNYPQEHVEQGYYFVLGDNRNYSADSRVGWFLPRENIIGKAWITYWPPRDWNLVKHYPLLGNK